MGPHDESCDIRTVHALELPARLSDAGGEEVFRGLYVDCETTGFGPEHDEIIELALLPFTYALDGRVVEVLHDEAQAHRNEPGRPLPEEITHLTGLTDDDVRGGAHRRRRRERALRPLPAHRRAQRAVRPAVRRAGPAGRACEALGVLAGGGSVDGGGICDPGTALPPLCVRSVRPGPAPRARGTARRGCGSSRGSSPSPARPSWPRSASGRSPRRCACGRFGPRSRRRRRFARGAIGGCRRCEMRLSARGGPRSSPTRWRASSRGSARRSTGGICPAGGSPLRRVSAFERWREDPADLAEPAPAHPGVPAPVVV